ncbi:S-adenosyl-L-methionine-dependent methyltransferase [Plectosphaerella plurivora]|uniref:Arsenite methyltransferase n=1 Tax=Plectosphaerella plurivora TaxID=936078 RepID=A0A9P8VCN8_9PEZI|nr:S-adenosyl-L-methionine-dependent methyltransferase [Plectosphaerella plurivora]
MDSKAIYDQVNARYGSAARSRTGQYENKAAMAFGYTEEELAAIPDGSNLGLSCGNPFPLAKLKEGECVIDLGSGAGFDVFTAARRVGLTGKAIGVDMNENMIAKAKANARKAETTNTHFVEAVITAVPLPDETADCIISNCVINLVPASEKQMAFNEMFRLLKPGGRLAISDILAKQEFTQEIRDNIALYVGCIAGAGLVSDYESFLATAGFHDVTMIERKVDLNVYLSSGDNPNGCCEGADADADIDTLPACGGESATASGTSASRPDIIDLNDWAGSFQIYAIKPLFH